MTNAECVALFADRQNKIVFIDNGIVLGESKRDCDVTHFDVQNMSCENEIFQKIKNDLISTIRRLRIT